MTINDAFLSELEKCKEKLEKADLVSYLMLANWMRNRMELNNELGLDVNKMGMIVENEPYDLLVLAYMHREGAKNLDKEDKKKFAELLEPVRKIYSEFGQLSQESFDDENEGWYDGHVDKLISEVGSLPYTGEITIYGHVKGAVLLFINHYVERAMKKNNYDALRLLRNDIRDALSHSFR